MTLLRAKLGFRIKEGDRFLLILKGIFTYARLKSSSFKSCSGKCFWPYTIISVLTIIFGNVRGFKLRAKHLLHIIKSDHRYFHFAITQIAYASSVCRFAFRVLESVFLHLILNDSSYAFHDHCIILILTSSNFAF